MKTSCVHCSQAFEISPMERALHAEHALPNPVDCPACRRQQRLLFRNFFHLYHRTCDLTGKKVISMYDVDVPFPVYATQEWWKDGWDPFSYGMKWDENKPFFSHVETLHRTVPRMAVMNTSSENTDYCNLCFYSRNCYLVHGCVNSEDCMYGHIVWRSRNCFDCLYLYESEYCSECIDCVKCYALSYSRDCDNCSSSRFLVHCVGCSDCFGCVGLKNKKYCIENREHTKEEYEAAMQAMDLGSSTTVAEVTARVEKLIDKEIVKFYHGFGCEECTGDYLYQCKNITEGYDLKRCEDGAHLATCEGFVSSTDCNFSGTASEHSHQCLTVEGHGLIGCHTCLQANADLLYCDNCFGCRDCIGCAGLKNKRFCILNTQYEEEEYKLLKEKIIAHLKERGEWGRFFPAHFSPFGYNETIADHYFPLEEAEVRARSWNWKISESDADQQYLGPENDVPVSVADAGDDIVKQIFRCEKSGKLFKILPQELAFYRQMNLPLPRRCFDERHKDRIARRNPRKLWDRKCAKCSAEMKTTYAPDRPEIVYCESCYLQTVY